MSHEIFEAALRVWGRDSSIPGLVESTLKSCGIASGSGLAEVDEEDLPKLLDKTIIRVEPDGGWDTLLDHVRKTWEECRKGPDAWRKTEAMLAAKGYTIGHRPSPGAIGAKHNTLSLDKKPRIVRAKKDPPLLRGGTRSEHSSAVEKALEHAADEAMRTEEVSTFIQTVRKSGADDAQVRELTKHAISDRLTAPRSIWDAAECLKKYLDFVRGKKRDRPDYQLAGLSSFVSIFDFLRSLATRGQSVPSAARHQLAVFKAVLIIEWDLSHPLIKSLTKTAGDKERRQAPSLPINLLTHLEKTAGDAEQPRLRRLFAGCIVLMCLATLRFADLQRTMEVATSETAFRGTMWLTKTKTGTARNWACPKMGTLGNDRWLKPILDCHRMLKRKMGDDATFLLPQISKQWSEMSLQPCSYSSARRMLVNMAEALGVEGSSRISLHSPRNFIPTASAQLGWSLEDRNKAGRWAKNSVMADRYDRSVAASELALRQDVLSALSKGWRPVGAYEVPKLCPRGNTKDRRPPSKKARYKAEEDDDSSEQDDTSDTSLTD